MADALPGRVVAKPILPVADIGAAADFYRRLGFEVVAYDDGYAWVHHHGLEILHLRLVPGLDPATNSASAYLHVQHVDAWHASMAAADDGIGDADDMPWSMREFAFEDPSGNLIRVGANL